VKLFSLTRSCHSAVTVILYCGLVAAGTTLAPDTSVAADYGGYGSPGIPSVKALPYEKSAGRDYGQYGPFDYYNPSEAPKDALYLVEMAHFGAKTADLARRGDWCFYWGDLDYTLRAFPNHPRALMTMAEYLQHHESCLRHMKSSTRLQDVAADMEAGGWEERTPDYYFKKGIEFRPQYAASHVIYGRYLAQVNRLDEALQQYLAAEKLDLKSADAQYYLGMLYLQKNDLAKAKGYAEKAYKLGAKSPELREKLVKAGAWNAGPAK
jgi:tetratricopeptide (TPR) repeat protein